MTTSPLSYALIGKRELIIRLGKLENLLCGSDCFRLRVVAVVIFVVNVQ